MKYISIASHDFATAPELINGKYTANRCIFVDFTTLEDLDNAGIHYWPEVNGLNGLLPGFTMYKVGDTGFLVEEVGSKEVSADLPVRFTAKGV